VKPTILLRIASVIAFLFAAGHTMGAPWTPGEGEKEQAVVESMKAVHFTVMGADRSYWDFYFGFGVMISVYLFALAVILWQSASLAKSDATRTRPMMLTLLAAYLIIGVVGWMYFFAIPVIMAAVICVCMILAWLSAGRQRSQGASSGAAALHKSV
jgi:hypothetical protein